AHYTSARLIITSSTNSSQNPPDEVFVFDDIQFREPSQGNASALYSIFLDAGQTLTADVLPTGTAQPTLKVWGSRTTVASTTASQPGGHAIIQNYRAPTAGQYLVSVSGVDQASGSAQLTLYANAAVELESRGGADNSSIATAQSLDDGFATIDGTAARTGIVGSLELGGSDYYSFTLL